MVSGDFVPTSIAEAPHGGVLKRKRCFSALVACHLALGLVIALAIAAVGPIAGRERPESWTSAMQGFYRAQAGLFGAWLGLRASGWSKRISDCVLCVVYFVGGFCLESFLMWRRNKGSGVDSRS